MVRLRKNTKFARMKKIIIIGPVPPIRGGIARHTHEMARSLSKDFQVEVLSPKLLFPRIFYPGRSQLTESVENSDNFLVAPYQLNRKSWLSLFKELLQVTRREKASVILPWWTWFLSPNILVCKWISDLRGLDVVVFCHNVLPHDANRFSRWVTKFTLSRFARFVVQSQEEKQELASLLKFRAIGVAPHPTYSSGTHERAQEESSHKLNLLFFGIVRGYKGVSKLSELIPHLDELSWNLTIVGEIWGKELEIELKNLARNHRNVELIDRFVSEEEKSTFFSHTDAVLLPYLKSTGSGVLADAKGFGVPVIASTKIAMGDEYREGIDGLNFNIEQDGSLLKAVHEFSNNRGKFKNPWSNVNSIEQWRNLAYVVARTLDE